MEIPRKKPEEKTTNNEPYTAKLNPHEILPNQRIHENDWCKKNEYDRILI